MAQIPTYRIERSQRKTVALKICPDGTLLVCAPLRYPARDIEQLVAQHQSWIATHRAQMERRIARENALAGTPEQVDALFRLAKETIPPKVAAYSRKMGITPNGIKITSAAKRFGSCSAKNSLCFSYRVMMYPEEAIDYVVVHELAHIRYHDHSPAFYALIATILPDYKQREAMLKERV